jgi:hypothetical protein
MGEGFADVWALMRCWRLAAGLPSAVAFGYRAVPGYLVPVTRLAVPRWVIAGQRAVPGEGRPRHSSPPPPRRLVRRPAVTGSAGTRTACSSLSPGRGAHLGKGSAVVQVAPLTRLTWEIIVCKMV